MADRISLYPDEPVLHVVLDGTFSVAHDMAKLIEDVTHTLDTTPRKLFYIVDLQHMKVTFEDLLVASNASARGANSYLHHPNIQELIIISTDRLVTFGVKGLQAPVFGIGTLSVFGTLEEALAHIRDKVMAV